MTVSAEAHLAVAADGHAAFVADGEDRGGTNSSSVILHCHLEYGVHAGEDAFNHEDTKDTKLEF